MSWRTSEVDEVKHEYFISNPKNHWLLIRMTLNHEKNGHLNFWKSRPLVQLATVGNELHQKNNLHIYDRE